MRAHSTQITHTRFDSLQSYSNERSLFLCGLRDEIEARWQVRGAPELLLG